MSELIYVKINGKRIVEHFLDKAKELESELNTMRSNLGVLNIGLTQHEKRIENLSDLIDQVSH